MRKRSEFGTFRFFYAKSRRLEKKKSAEKNVFFLVVLFLCFLCFCVFVVCFYFTFFFYCVCFFCFFLCFILARPAPSHVADLMRSNPTGVIGVADEYGAPIACEFEILLGWRSGRNRRPERPNGHTARRTAIRVCFLEVEREVVMGVFEQEVVVHEGLTLGRGLPVTGALDSHAPRPLVLDDDKPVTQGVRVGDSGCISQHAH